MKTPTCYRSKPVPVLPQAEDDCSTCLFNRTCIVQDEQFEETKPENKERLAWLEDAERKQLKEFITHQEELIKAMEESNEYFISITKGIGNVRAILTAVLGVVIGFTLGVVFV